MKAKAGKFLRVILPTLMLCSPANASSARTFSRYRGKNVAVLSKAADAVSRQMAENRGSDPFAVFGDAAKPVNAEIASVGPDVLDFLRKNDLLWPGQPSGQPSQWRSWKWHYRAQGFCPRQPLFPLPRPHMGNL